MICRIYVVSHVTIDCLAKGIVWVAGSGAGSNKSAAQVLRDRLKAKVGAKRASEPPPEVPAAEAAAGSREEDGAADSTGMDGATRRLRLDSADTPAKRVKTESGVVLAAKSEDVEGFAASAASAEKMAEGQEGAAAFWAELGGTPPTAGVAADAEVSTARVYESPRKVLQECRAVTLFFVACPMGSVVHALYDHVPRCVCKGAPA